MAPLSPQLFALLSSLVEERSGLHYAPRDLPLFSDKLGARMVEAGFESALDYYYFLRYDPGAEAEASALVDALVVGETYLFREANALLVAVEHVIRPAIEACGHARVWSAGCATGEEPFTLAMILAEQGLLRDVDLVASDVSTKALARARAGVVPQRSLRTFTGGISASETAQRIAEPWLTLQPGGGAAIARSIVEAIEFRRESILDPPDPPSLSAFDLVLCRNVMIYFRDEVVRRVVENLAARLRPGGRLLVGTTESLLRFGTLLQCEERAGAFLYKRDDP